MIVSVHTDYKGQVFMDEPVSVITRIAGIGNKSFRLFQQLLDTDSREVKSECTTVLVAFDFKTQRSIEIPRNWREKLSEEMAGSPEQKNG